MLPRPASRCPCTTPFRSGAGDLVDGDGRPGRQQAAERFGEGGHALPDVEVGRTVQVVGIEAQLERGVVHERGEDRKSTRLKSSHKCATRMPSTACKKKV